MCQLNALGSYKHMMWECPPVQDLWGQAAKVLSDLTGKAITHNPSPLLIRNDSQSGFNERQHNLLLGGHTAFKELN